jgi:hypothetical protein
MGFLFSRSQPTLQEVQALLAKVHTVKPGESLHLEERQGIFPIVNVLVIGLHHSGKSSLVNTMLRVLNEEWEEPFRFYASSGPRDDNVITNSYARYRPKKHCLAIYDAYAPDVFDEFDSNSLYFYERCIAKGIRPFSTFENCVEDPDHKIHVTLLVVKPDYLRDSYKRKQYRQLCEYLQFHSKISSLFHKLSNFS